MTTLTFRIPGYRHREHVSEGFSFAFSFDEPETEQTLVQLQSFSAEKDQEKVVKSALKWIEYLAAMETPVPEAAQFDITDIDPDVIKIFQKERANRYRQSTLLQCLLIDCPNTGGRLNLAVEILLTAANTKPTNPIVSADELLALSPCQQSPAPASLERLKKLADELLLCMLQPLRSLGCKTPVVNSVNSDLSSSQPSRDQGVQGRQRSLPDRVNIRDQYTCVISGCRSEKIRLMFPEDVIKEQQLRFTTLQCAHIIPHNLNEMNDRLELNQSKVQVWSLLNFYSPGLSEKFKGSQIDQPDNALMLATAIHNAFGALNIWLTLEERSEDWAIYRLESNRRSTLEENHWPPEGKVRLRTFKEIKMADPYYLALHRAFAKAISMSAGAELLDSIQHDMETTVVLSEDPNVMGSLDRRLQSVVACR